MREMSIHLWAHNDHRVTLTGVPEGWGVLDVGGRQVAVSPGQLLALHETAAGLLGLEECWPDFVVETA